MQITGKGKNRSTVRGFRLHMSLLFALKAKAYAQGIGLNTLVVRLLEKGLKE
jgi:predicted DNA binding CopG/RHH family protein